MSLEVCSAHDFDVAFNERDGCIACMIQSDKNEISEELETVKSERDELLEKVKELEEKLERIMEDESPEEVGVLQV